MQCNSMQGLYAQLTGEDQLMQCNSVKGFYARLPGEDISTLLYIYIYIYICSVTVCKTSMLD